jgi:hypothetical protein
VRVAASKKEAGTAERAQAGDMGWLGGWFAAASCSLKR